MAVIHQKSKDPSVTSNLATVTNLRPTNTGKLIGKSKSKTVKHTKKESTKTNSGGEMLKR